jgi:hypothetical protein
MKGKKVKLTLSVDREVVEAAKKLDLNLSEVTENILRGFSFKPKSSDKSYLTSKYKELFDSMKPLLKEYNISVRVGTDYAFQTGDTTYSDPLELPMFLLPSGILWIDEFETAIVDLSKVDPNVLHPPKKILSDLIVALSNVKEKRKEELKEIEMVRRIVGAISGPLMKPKDYAKFTRESTAAVRKEISAKKERRS